MNTERRRVGGYDLGFCIDRCFEPGELNFVARVEQRAGVVHALGVEVSLASKPPIVIAAIFIQVRRE